jgi:hypothetical protein
VHETSSSVAYCLCFLAVQSRPAVAAAVAATAYTIPV